MPTQFSTDYKGGPLAKLEQSGYSINNFSYPIDLTADPGEQHFVMFYINETSNTQFPTKAKGGELGPNGASASPRSGRPAIQDSGNLMNWKNRPIHRVSTAIALYMPPSLSTSYTPVWEAIDGNAAFGVAKAAQDGDMGRVLQEMGAGVAVGLMHDAQDFLKSGLGVDTDIEGAASLAARAAKNPNQEVLFRTIGFREYQFNYKFTPRSEQEAQNVANIIKAFKFYASPEVKQSPGAGRFFIYPAEFDIEFWSNGQKNNFVNKISTCACTGVSVDYTGSGAWSAFRPGSNLAGVPVETNLSLTFKELEIITKNRIIEGF
jgi:hypothetical protein